MLIIRTWVTSDAADPRGMRIRTAEQGTQSGDGTLCWSLKLTFKSCLTGLFGEL